MGFLKKSFQHDPKWIFIMEEKKKSLQNNIISDQQNAAVQISVVLPFGII